MAAFHCNQHTDLYNDRPCSAEPHRKLDQAVFAADELPSSLTDAEVLERLLALNYERAAWQGQQGAAQLAQSPPPVEELVD